MYETMKGNNFASKWTEAQALALVEEAIAWANEQPDLYFLITITTRQGYYSTVYDYLEDKYESFKAKKAELLKILAKNLADSAIKNETNPTMTIFVLKNNHGWKDKKDIDLTSQGEKIRQNVFMLPDEDDEG